MANCITNQAHPNVCDLQMSNGLSDVFFAGILLSLSALAQTPWQNGLALWFAEHDAEHLRGLGTLGFDVAEMPWQPMFFTFQQSYLLGAIEDALAERWSPLPPQSAQPLADALATFRALIKKLRTQDLAERIRWPMKPLEQLEYVERCPIHAVMLHALTYADPQRLWGTDV